MINNNYDYDYDYPSSSVISTHDWNTIRGSQYKTHKTWRLVDLTSKDNLLHSMVRKVGDKRETKGNHSWYLRENR